MMRNSRRRIGRTLAGLAVPLLAPWLAAAQEPVVVLPPEPAAQVAPLPAGPLTLTECIGIALQRQPAVAASRASLAAAQAQVAALENLRLANLISRELPIRRKQADLGVVISTAGVNQAEWEAVYAVTRNYFSVLYATEQEQVAQDVIGSLRATYVGAESALRAGARTATREDLDRITAYRRLAEARLVDARMGRARAVAALREAMGVEPDFPIQIASTGLPIPRYELTRDQVIGLALCRRGELISADNLARVVALEVEAQGTSCRPTFRTFASVVDIHARPIPQGLHNRDYRPGAIGPEMPVSLAGHREDRQARARAFADRAEAVVAKTRNLIVLEAENAYLQWRQAADKLTLTREAASRAGGLSRQTQENFTGGQNVSVRDVLESLLLSSQARVSYNETRYQYLLALADLQRITAGGVSLEGVGDRRAEAAGRKAEGEKKNADRNQGNAR